MHRPTRNHHTHKTNQTTPPRTHKGINMDDEEFYQHICRQMDEHKTSNEEALNIATSIAVHLLRGQREWFIDEYLKKLKELILKG